MDHSDQMLLTDNVRFGCPLRELAQCREIFKNSLEITAHLQQHHHFASSSPLVQEMSNSDFLMRLSSRDMLFCMSQDQQSMLQCTVAFDDLEIRLVPVGDDPISTDDRPPHDGLEENNTDLTVEMVLEEKGEEPEKPETNLQPQAGAMESTKTQDISEATEFTEKQDSNKAMKLAKTTRAVEMVKQAEQVRVTRSKQNTKKLEENRSIEDSKTVENAETVQVVNTLVASILEKVVDFSETKATNPFEDAVEVHPGSSCTDNGTRPTEDHAGLSPTSSDSAHQNLPTCSVCREQFSSLPNALKHLRSVHKIPKGDPRYSAAAIGKTPRSKCQFCGKLVIHLSRHQKNSCKSVAPAEVCQVLMADD